MEYQHLRLAVRVGVVIAVALTSLSAQGPLGPPLGPGQGSGRGRPGPASVEKIGDHLFQLGPLRVDTDKREVMVPGHVNDKVTTLEFVANTIGGYKAYESALTLDVDAVTFNAALMLIGLDPSHARVPTQHFDPIPPAGDAVELWIDWRAGDSPRRARVEQLLFDKRTMHTLAEGPWVYTGSSFGPGGRYLAEIDGVLIGFVHSPAPVIENPRSGAVSSYGSVVLNTELVPPGTLVMMTIKAVAASTPAAR